jgi:hypothetical protein
MAMLITWQTINAIRFPRAHRFDRLGATLAAAYAPRARLVEALREALAPAAAPAREWAE